MSMEMGRSSSHLTRYEVAPGYMGTVEFVIPDEVTADIRK